MISSGERSVSASISRSDFAISDSGNPNSRRVASAVRRRALEHRPHLGRLERVRPHRVQLAGRAGQDDHRRPVGGDDEPRCGPGGIDRRRPLWHHRLLAVCLPQRVGIEAQTAGERTQHSRDLLLHPLVEDHLATGEAADDLGREVVRGGPETAAGDDEIHSLVGEEAKRRFEVVGPVPDHDDLGDVDTELREPLRQPRAVAVADPPGQHLGPGDDDARPGAHGQPGPV